MIGTDRIYPSKRILSLDVLRGIAILLVMFSHTVASAYGAGFLSPLAVKLHCVGWTGVDLFFVLSGFLIGGLLMQEIRKTGGLRVFRFLFRRGFKIWPQYYTYLFISALVLGPLYGRPLRDSIFTVLPGLVHVQNYSHRWQTQIWSLAVEEHFYILLPITLILLLRFSPPYILSKALGSILVAVMCFELTLRCLILRPPYDLPSHYTATHIRLDSLAAGVFLAWLRVFHSQTWNWLLGLRTPLLIVAVVSIAPFLFIQDTSRFTYTVGYTLLYLGYSCLLIWALGFPPVKSTPLRLLAGAFAMIGTWSYGIYMWHMDVGHEIVQWGTTRYIPSSAISYTFWMGLYFALAILAGYLATILVERPFLRLRDRLLPTGNHIVVRTGAVPGSSLPSCDAQPLQHESSNHSLDIPLATSSPEPVTAPI